MGVDIGTDTGAVSDKGTVNSSDNSDRSQNSYYETEETELKAKTDIGECIDNGSVIGS